MEDTANNYIKMTKNNLVILCKERGIRGYAANGMNKDKIILLIKEHDSMEKTIKDDYSNMNYDTLLALCRERKIKGYFGRSPTGKVIATKEMMIKSLKENIVRKSLFDYLTENNPSIITKFVGNKDNLKLIPYGTNNKYIWKCDNSKCSNTFEAKPSDLYKNDLPRLYCNNCTKINKDVKAKIKYLERSGSIQKKFPFIKNIWSKENVKMPDEICRGSNEKIKLKCPNKSTKHPDYEITVNHIQDHNSFRCPKCVTKTSNVEMRIYSELKYSFKDVKWQQKIEGREADITIEDIKLVIEIDGYPWHKNKAEKDLEKNIIFEKKGYTVLRIRDTRLEKISCDNIVFNLADLSLNDYNKIIEWINIKFKCGVSKYYEWKNTDYYKEIQVSKMYVKYEESIEYLFPESKTIWDYEKNYPFIPSQLSKGSHMEIWVKCNSGHSWKRRLNHLFRTIKGEKKIMNCPDCPDSYKPKSNKIMLKINGVSYRSILQYCKQKNIDRRKLYTQLKQNNIDITVTANIEKFIEENLED
jgi:very-short-patch-repair endonuclease